MDLESLIISTHVTWNDTEQEILHYLLNNKEEASRSSVQHIAQRSYTSTSSVMRLAKKLGLSGISELKYVMRNSLQESKKPHDYDSFNLQKQDIEATLAHLDSMTLEPIAQRIIDSATTYCLGTGTSQRLAASELAKSLMNNGQQASVLTDLKEAQICINMMKPEDTLIVISLSGSHPDYASLISAASVRGVPTLAITRLGNSPLSAAARWNIHYCSTPLPAPWHLGNFYSLVGLSIATDYLIRSIMNLKMHNHT